MLIYRKICDSEISLDFTIVLAAVVGDSNREINGRSARCPIWVIAPPTLVDIACAFYIQTLESTIANFVSIFESHLYHHPIIILLLVFYD